ncbi:hypothetical protein AXG93_2097s1100 [Marchantia polymorpha subsp. ruderalis]|uniref:Uncharacterized protein n=1 Tax=Marchantia polymorpha subsp. ruderalis TaxID=1480154 RepID=A0A176W2V7_MARPO|nr:hypothetical protein AXG93_2097s1100 [Marchantia polymorpha subsp. ruderalis]
MFMASPCMQYTFHLRVSHVKFSTSVVDYMSYWCEPIPGFPLHVLFFWKFLPGDHMTVFYTIASRYSFGTATASHENKDLDQLRGQMLLVTARDARQHAIAAAQAISTARQATMQLDQVKREASALTASQEEEIKKLSVDLNHCHDLLQRKDSLLKEKEREEERLMYLVKELEGALNSSQLEVAAYRKRIEVMNNEAEEKATRFQDLLDSLEFSRASARASEHHLQEARIQKKDTAIQNELLQHKVAELESREVQTTIAHYDLELCKVRTLLEGEKTHLLMELAKLRQGNRSLKGEVAEWRGRYNTVLKQTNLKSGEDLVPTTFEPAEISCAKLRKFFSVDCFDDETYLVPDSTKRMSKEENICSGMAPTNEVTNRSELQNTQDGPHNYIVRYDEGRLDTKDCLRGGEHSTQEKMNGWRVKTQDRKENGDDLLLLSDRIEDGRYRNSEWGGSSCTDNQLRLIENMEYQNGRVRLDDRRELDDDEVCTSGRQLEPELQATNTVVTREKSFDYGSLSAAEAKTKNERKLRSVSFLDQLMYGPDNGTLALQDETCFEMGENLLSVAHRELVKLKRGKRGDSGCIPFSASLRLFGPIIFFLLQVVSRQFPQHTSLVKCDSPPVVAVSRLTSMTSLQESSGQEKTENCRNRDMIWSKTMATVSQCYIQVQCHDLCAKLWLKMILRVVVMVAFIGFTKEKQYGARF